MILQPTIFSPTIQYVAIANSDEIIFETEDNYQKQTYRNRYYIYGANGKQLLNIPIIHTKSKEFNKTKDIQIDKSFSWQKLHIKSLQSAYRSSPYFEFYEDELLNFYNKKFKYLIDLNFQSFQLMVDFLQSKLSYTKSNEYQIEYEKILDFRNLVDAKSKVEYPFKEYTQVFDNKFSFIPNLSILDLIFNEGPNALEYLEDHKNLLF